MMMKQDEGLEANISQIFASQASEVKKLKTLYMYFLKHDKVSASHKSMLQLLSAKVEKLEWSVKKAKFWHYLLRITVFLLSGSATVLLAFKDRAEWMSDAALMVTTVITFLTTLAAFWSVEEYWLSRKVMLNRVKEIRYELLIHIAAITDGEEVSEQLKTLFDQFLNIISDDYWENLLRNLPRKDNNGAFNGVAPDITEEGQICS